MFCQLTKWVDVNGSNFILTTKGRCNLYLPYGKYRKTKDECDGESVMVDFLSFVDKRERIVLLNLVH